LGGGTVANPTCAIGFECLGAQNVSRWALGGLLQYNFGPVTLQFWATDTVYSHASGSSLNTAGLDPSAGVNGPTFWFQASYALWTPPEAAPAPKSPLIYK
jgi:hypothetical protein